MNTVLLVRCYLYRSLTIALLTITTFSFAVTHWGTDLPSGMPAKISSIHPLWEPSLPPEPELKYQPYGIATQIQCAIENLIRSGKYSVTALNKLIFAILFNQSVPPTPPTNLVSLPSGVVNELGAGGSKASPSKKNPPKNTAAQKKKTTVSRSTPLIDGVPFTLISNAKEDTASHHSTMETIVSLALSTQDKAIGGGATSLVYKIELNGKIYAVKKATSKKNISTLKTEGVTLLEINHPNIIKLEILAWSDSNALLVFEYYLSDLWERLINPGEKGTPTLAEAICFLNQLASALAYLHEQGFSHSDLKPENILVSSSGNLALADLGNLSGLNRPRPKLNSGIYAAPEVQSGQIPNQISDLWEFGIIIAFFLKPEKIADMLSSSAGYMTVFEFVGRYAAEDGAPSEWQSILQVTSESLSKDLLHDEPKSWHLLSNQAFLYALTTMCLKLTPTKRPSIAQVYDMISGYLDHSRNCVDGSTPIPQFGSNDDND